MTKAQGVTCWTAAEGYILGAKLYPAREVLMVGMQINTTPKPNRM
jgi:hypothetical protein